MTSITVCLSTLSFRRFMTLLLLFIIYNSIIIIFDDIMLYQSSSYIIPNRIIYSTTTIFPITMAFRLATTTITTINHHSVRPSSITIQSGCHRLNNNKCYRNLSFRSTTFHLLSLSSSSNSVIDMDDDYIQNKTNNHYEQKDKSNDDNNENDHHYDESSSSLSLSSSNVIHNTETQTNLSSSSATTTRDQYQNQQQHQNNDIPLLITEGLFAINKPLNWTSSNIVSYIRKMLEHDTRKRGIIPGKVGTKSKRVIKVGHGGTLDPLATGVLVIGVGNGTKLLSNYLSGNKIYTATGQFGFETTTLDMEGNITKTLSYDHITSEMIHNIIQQHFIGTIKQTPPLFSAIKKGGKALYEIARKLEKQQQLNNDKSLDNNNIIIESRNITIYNIKCYNIHLPYFTIEVECGGGTYIRSLIRDIAYQLNTVATTIKLERIKQGPFHINDSLSEVEWKGNVTSIYNAIQYYNDNNIINKNE